jgi:hypothetical protein
LSTSSIFDFSILFFKLRIFLGVCEFGRIKGWLFILDLGSWFRVVSASAWINNSRPENKNCNLFIFENCTTLAEYSQENSRMHRQMKRLDCRRR